MIQFHVIVEENRESIENSSMEDRFSINPTIDVSTTTSSVSPELLQLELLERLGNFLSGDGLINRNSKGVCWPMLVVGAFDILWLIFWVLFTVPSATSITHFMAHLAVYSRFHLL